jgi:hypothetical protein
MARRCSDWKDNFEAIDDADYRLKLRRKKVVLGGHGVHTRTVYCLSTGWPSISWQNRCHSTVPCDKGGQNFTSARSVARLARG